MTNPQPTITILVNGEPRPVPPGTSVESLVRLLGLSGGACAAEVNKSLVPRRQHAQTALHDGDRIELVSLVGGG